MSGPKVSVYILTEIQREIIAAERRKRQMELQVHLQLESDLNAAAQRCTELAARVESYKLIADECRRQLSDSILINDVGGIIAAIGEINNEVTVAKRNSNNLTIQQALFKTSKDIDTVLQKINALSAKANEQEKKLSREMDQTISSLFPSGTNETDNDTIPIAEQERIKKALAVLHNYSSFKYLPSNLQGDVAKACKQLESETTQDNIDGYLSIEIQPLMKRCAHFVELWEKCGKRYQELEIRYEVLWNSNHDNEAIKLVPFDENCIEVLNRAIAEQEIKAQKNAEKVYIEKALSDVMVEMGYDLLAHRDVTKRNGTQFRNEVYQYCDDAVVNVTYADDGRIAMELGKEDAVDRLPTDLEGRKLEQQMVSFCHDFKTVEQKLAERGVALGDRVMLAPPSSGYAQIINMSDFKLVEKSNVGFTKGEHKTKAKGKRYIDLQ